MEIQCPCIGRRFVDLYRLLPFTVCNVRCVRMSIAGKTHENRSCYIRYYVVAIHIYTNTQLYIRIFTLQPRLAYYAGQSFSFYRLTIDVFFFSKSFKYVRNVFFGNLNFVFYSYTSNYLDVIFKTHAFTSLRIN